MQVGNAMIFHDLSIAKNSETLLSAVFSQGQAPFKLSNLTIVEFDNLERQKSNLDYVTIRLRHDIVEYDN